MFRLTKNYIVLFFAWLVFFYSFQFLTKKVREQNISSHKNKFCVKVKNFSERAKAKPSLKIRRASAIFWNYLGIFRDYGIKYIFFRNKTFFFQDRKLKVSASV